MIIAVDFDGTIVENKYPEIGEPVPGSLEVMRELQEAGHELILWTVRSCEQLRQAAAYCALAHIKLSGVNENPGQKYWNGSPKAYAALYIDDAAIGCPLVEVKGSRPYADWVKIRAQLVERGILK